ncbi:hypothetical protein [Dechloromonas denitrificans]|uniref:hypothetical protein n=1 Tax=Dechloromonas denitrificans TaxID=281362 RepID=UPI0012FADC74|nr:hypothetical protein [Dechloromonas denitrificans]
MKITLNGVGNNHCLVFEGKMTCKFAREIENSIIDMMRRHPKINVDLSRVHEIDRCGVHLLSVLKSFGGEAVKIIATSPEVEITLHHLYPLHQHVRPGSNGSKFRKAPALQSASL